MEMATLIKKSQTAQINEIKQYLEVDNIAKVIIEFLVIWGMFEIMVEINEIMYGK